MGFKMVYNMLAKKVLIIIKLRFEEKRRNLCIKPIFTFYFHYIIQSADEELRTALRIAFDVGYRYIDTASFYENEHIIGEVLKEYIEAGKLKRSDVFITTKVFFNC